jgi:hypothetical protein
MRFRSAVVAAVIATAVAPAASAAPPTKTTTSVDLTRLSVGTSRTCGFDVFTRLVGRITTTLHYDAAGNVVREFDHGVNFRTVFFAPSQGTSYEFPLGGGNLTQYYPDGATIGAPARVVVTGLVAKVPGQPADAGRSEFVGQVVDFTPEGVPVVDFDLFDPVTQSGHTGSDTRANRCAALRKP